MTGSTCIGKELPAWAVSTLDRPLVYAARTIGYLGPRGTFTEEALLTVLAGARSAGFVPPQRLAFPTVSDTIEAVSTGEIDCAIVPIENSIEGSVSATLDFLTHETENVQVVREIRHPIRHRLVAASEMSLEDVTKVISYPNALGQCRRWLRKNLPGVEIEAASSTAQAVERVAGSNEPWAAIGSALAAEEYGCTVLRENIEDSDDNETRFIFLARQRERQDLPGQYKTSVACEIFRDQPGALLLILQEFAHRYINLTKIESRPTKQSLGDYIFLIDLEGKVDDPQVADALKCLNCKLARVAVFGSYPVGRP